MKRLLVSISEAAELLGVGTSTIRRLIKSGDLQSVKIRRRRGVRVDSLIVFAGKGTSLDVYKKVLAGPKPKGVNR
jgi:excisionase family DNA binding protein